MDRESGSAEYKGEKFAAWEHSYVNVLGLGARLRGQLAGLPGVTVHDLGQARCAIVTAKIDGLAAEQAAEALARAGVNVTATVAEDNPLDTRTTTTPTTRWTAQPNWSPAWPGDRRRIG
jgi:selenocysteine lyase/cysteine desulfurase